MDVQEIAKRIAEIENKPIDTQHIQEAEYYKKVLNDGEVDCNNISIDDVRFVLEGGWIYNKERMEKLGLVDDTYHSRLVILREIKHSFEKMNNMQKSITNSFLVHFKKELNKLSTDVFLSNIKSIVGTEKIIDTAEMIAKISISL